MLTQELIFQTIRVNLTQPNLIFWVAATILVGVGIMLVSRFSDRNSWRASVAFGAVSAVGVSGLLFALMNYDLKASANTAAAALVKVADGSGEIVSADYIATAEKIRFKIRINTGETFLDKNIATVTEVSVPADKLASLKALFDSHNIAFSVQHNGKGDTDCEPAKPIL